MVYELTKSQKKRKRLQVDRAARQRKRIMPVKNDYLFKKIWFMVEGGILMTMDAHPEYFAGDLRGARQSMTKRITNQIVKTLKNESFISKIVRNEEMQD